MGDQKRRRTAIVPRLVFQTACAGVIPAIAASCGGSTSGERDGRTATGGVAGSVGTGGRDVNVLAVGGYGGSGGYYSAGGRDIIVLAVGGYGTGGFSVAAGGFGGYAGFPGPGGNVVVLAVGGFGGSDAGPADAGVDAPSSGGAGGSSGSSGSGGDIIILAINGFGLLAPDERVDGQSRGGKSKA
jgi:hypothetical protein